MGDIHIHAREDVTGKETHKETFATAAAAALHGGVVHVADMPNNPAAPIDDASYAAKETARSLGQHLPVAFTLYAGIGPGTRPLSRDVPYKAYMGPSVGDLFFSQPGAARPDAGALPRPGGQLPLRGPGPAGAAQGRGDARDAPAARVRAERHPLRPGDDREVRPDRQAVPLLGRRGAAADPRRQGAAACRVTAEVTPHHVFFDTADDHAEPIAPWMQMNPPLRSPADRAAMLEALRDGTADYLATDHAPHTHRGEGSAASPASRTWTPTAPFVTWLLVEQGFTPERIAAICSANPGAFVNPYQRGEVRPAAAGLRRLADGARPAAADDGPPRGTAARGAAGARSRG